MSAVAGFPGLSQLLAWPTEHLTEAADYWEAVGGRSYGVANWVWQDALSIDWQGEAADRLRTATQTDMLTTSAVADQLQAAAKVARSGVDEAVVFYYITDLEEGGAPFGDSPETIASYGDRQAGLPERPSDIPAAYRYTRSPEAPSAERSQKQDPPVINEPRRDADPL
jgi:hypothetical protein